MKMTMRMTNCEDEDDEVDNNDDNDEDYYVESGKHAGGDDYG